MWPLIAGAMGSLMGSAGTGALGSVGSGSMVEGMTAMDGIGTDMFQGMGVEGGNTQGLTPGNMAGLMGKGGGGGGGGSGRATAEGLAMRPLSQYKDMSNFANTQSLMNQTKPDQYQMKRQNQPMGQQYQSPYIQGLMGSM